MMDEVFHHLHHSINRSMRESNPDTPEVPEERNPIFFVYPICMGISLILCILWLAARLLNHMPIIALLGNGVGGILMLIGGISAMRHAEKYINLNEVSDEALLVHPIFIHNFVICIISIFGLILYLVPTWILFDACQWCKRHKKNKRDRAKSIDAEFCTCSHNRSCLSPRSSPGLRERNACSRTIESTSQLRKNSTNKQDLQNEPVILYCCCVDCHRYLKTSRRSDDCTHEFQVIQIM